MGFESIRLGHRIQEVASMTTIEVSDRERLLEQRLAETTAMLVIASGDMVRLESELELARMKSYAAQISEVAKERDALRLAAQAGLDVAIRATQLVFMNGTLLDVALKAAITQLRAALGEHK